MANVFLTPEIIARESLMILESNAVMAGLCYRDFENDFGPAKVGDTISIRKPASFTAQEFAGTINVQDAKEGRVSLTLDKHLDVSTSVTSKEWTLSLDDFSNRIIRPAMAALNEKIDSYLCSLYTQFNQVAGTAGTAPARLKDLADLDKAMNEAKIPVAGRRVVVSPATKAAMFSIDAVARADARGDDGTALRDASIGRIMGMEWYMDQNIVTHEAGTGAAVATLKVSTAVNEGEDSMSVSGGSGAETLLAGDVFTVAGVPGSFTVTEDSTAASGSFTLVKFSPAAPAGGFAANAAITFQATHAANMAFVREAIALAIVPLELPRGAQGNAAYVPYNGMGIRVVQSYNADTKTDVISFDLLMGAKVIDPRLGVRFMA